MVIRKYSDGVPKELQMLHPPPEYEVAAQVAQ